MTEAMWALAGILVTAIVGYVASVKPTRLTLADNEKERRAAAERHRADLAAATERHRADLAAARVVMEAHQADAVHAAEQARADVAQARADARDDQAIEVFTKAMVLWSSSNEGERLAGLSLLSGMIANEDFGELAKSTLDAFASSVFGIRLAELRRIVRETGRLPDIDVEFIEDEGGGGETTDDNEPKGIDPDGGGALT